MNNEELIAEARRFVSDTSNDFYENHLARSLADALERTDESLEYYKTLPHVSVYTRLERERDEAEARAQKANLLILDEVRAKNEALDDRDRYREAIEAVRTELLIGGRDLDEYASTLTRALNDRDGAR